MSVLAGGAIVKRSVRVAGHQTSVSLEDAFWHALKDIAAARGIGLNALIAEIDTSRVDAGEDAAATNLSSAIRVYVLEWYRNAPRP
ncbi:MAG: ribbon-helix-helix domain-containing protein [Rhodospirillaceae bacterium]